MKRNHIRPKRICILLTALLIFIIAAVCAIRLIYPYAEPYLSRAATRLRSVRLRPVSISSLIQEPLAGCTETVLYTNNEPKKNADKVQTQKDNKLMEYADGVTRLTDFTTGFSINLPGKMEPDFTHSPNYIKLTSDFCDITISRERSPYEDIDEYIAHYLNRFITNEDYQVNNGIELMADTTRSCGTNNVRIISVKIADMPQDRKNVYTYATIKTGGREFFRLMLRFRTNIDGEIEKATETILSSFARRDPLGTAVYDLHYQLKTPSFWSKETKKTYRSLQNRSDVMWGIFASQVQEDGIKNTIPKMEQKLDFTFPIVLIYNHIGQPIAQDFTDICARDGRMIELTLQMTETNNEDLYCKSPLIETYKGKYDDKIRALARQLKEQIKTPFFFRLNNEMNTDWANYSGIVNLSDPEIYIGCWQRVYKIFEEEGVDNAIWVFNPNDRNYPPCNWNNFLAYYPGDDYVQMIGVTGYNTGTYYKDVTGEEWRSFTEIYDEVQKAYKPFFSDFPWIITEFASSSIGGNKPLWISNMFKNLHRYPNIKAAVWFSAPDIDMRPGHEGTVSRPYMLDETDETLSAFRQGIKK